MTTMEELKTSESAVPLLTFDIEEGEMYPTSPVSPVGRKDNVRVGGKWKKRTPLPLLQLFILCLVRLAEPIAYTQIFPVCIFLPISYSHNSQGTLVYQPGQPIRSSVRFLIDGGLSKDDGRTKSNGPTF